MCSKLEHLYLVCIVRREVALQRELSEQVYAGKQYNTLHIIDVVQNELSGTGSFSEQIQMCVYSADSNHSTNDPVSWPDDRGCLRQQQT